MSDELEKAQDERDRAVMMARNWARARDAAQSAREELQQQLKGMRAARDTVTAQRDVALRQRDEAQDARSEIRRHRNETQRQMHIALAEARDRLTREEEINESLRVQLAAHQATIAKRRDATARAAEIIATRLFYYEKDSGRGWLIPSFAEQGKEPLTELIANLIILAEEQHQIKKDEKTCPGCGCHGNWPDDEFCGECKPPPPPPDEKQTYWQQQIAGRLTKVERDYDATVRRQTKLLLNCLVAVTTQMLNRTISKTDDARQLGTIIDMLNRETNRP